MPSVYDPRLHLRTTTALTALPSGEPWRWAHLCQPDDIGHGLCGAPVDVYCYSTAARICPDCFRLSGGICWTHIPGQVAAVVDAGAIAYPDHPDHRPRPPLDEATPTVR